MEISRTLHWLLYVSLSCYVVCFVSVGETGSIFDRNHGCVGQFDQNRRLDQLV